MQGNAFENRSLEVLVNLGFEHPEFLTLLIFPQPNCLWIRHLWCYKEGPGLRIHTPVAATSWVPSDSRLSEQSHVWPWKHMVILGSCTSLLSVRKTESGLEMSINYSTVFSLHLSDTKLNSLERRQARAERRILLLLMVRP